MPEPGVSCLKSTLSPAKQALLEKRLRGESVKIIPRHSDGGRAQLSFAQLRLWFLNQLEPDSAFYNTPLNVRIEGHIDSTALQRSINEVVRRHEVLRTTFQLEDGKPALFIAPLLDLPITLIDSPGLLDDEKEPFIRAACNREARKPFDLAKGPILRATLLKLSEQDHVLMLTTHHVASDAWSSGVLIDEIVGFYKSFTTGEPSNLPELPIQYSDFARWQRERLQNSVLEEQLAFWRQTLHGELPLIELPTDRPRPPLQTFNGDRVSLAVSQELTESLKELCNREGVTLFVLLLAAYKMLLFHYSGQEDIIVGSPAAGRNRPELERLIGFFINMLLLRTDLSGDPGFRELLKRVREVTLGAYEHQEAPFEKLVEEFSAGTIRDRSPLFQVAFALDNTPRKRIDIPGLRFRLVKIENQTTRYDLVLNLTDLPQGLSGDIQYNTDLFERATISRMARNLEIILTRVSEQPRIHLSELRVAVSEAERRQDEAKRKGFKKARDQMLKGLQR